MTTKANATDDSFHVFDTTLRDGAQREGINLTVADKLTIARHPGHLRCRVHRGRLAGCQPARHGVLRPGRTTESTTRVLITTGDGDADWATVGVGRERHRRVLAAEDAYTYGLLRAGVEPTE
ncbi:(R)-citramalate synthase OS=Streptomyces microflavus OX=1919 GN=cimA PE=3 SV=1 [Streptomyces microflavus]